MGTVSLTLPSDGQTIDASDVNNPLNTLAAEINGQLDNSNIKSGAAIDRSKIAGFTDGWESLGYAPTTITALGNRSYTVVIPSVDTTTATSPGQRLKLPRTVTAPTGSITLNGTTQYANKTSPAGMTFTDDFVVSAWVKLSSYAQGGIASCFDSNSGWLFWVDSTGQVILQGNNANAANYSRVRSYQSIPLNKWVHISAQLDMSAFTATTTTSYVMIDGKDVPANVERAGTNPTALVQAGNQNIGAWNGGTAPFPGKIAQVAIYSAKVTQATILASMNQTLTGSETNLVSAYTFNGASGINDLSANANNLTAQGSPTYASDTPFTNAVTGTSVIAGTTNYGIIMAQTFSTNTTYTIQIPEGETLPTTGGIGTVSYSTQKTPYGFPGDAGKWVLETRINSSITSQNLSTNVWSIFLSGLTLGIYLPIGAWRHGYKGSVQWSAGGVASLSGHIALTSSAPANSTYSEQVSSNDYDASTQYLSGPQHASGSVSLTAATQYNLYATYDQGTATVTCSIRGDVGSFTIFAENAYL